MGTYLREARSRKAGLVLDALDRLQGEEQKKRLEKLMPRTMTVREWEEFVKHVDSIEFRVSNFYYIECLYICIKNFKVCQMIFLLFYSGQKNKNARKSFKTPHPTYHKSRRLRPIGGEIGMFYSLDIHHVKAIASLKI